MLCVVHFCNVLSYIVCCCLGKFSKPSSIISFGVVKVEKIINCQHNYMMVFAYFHKNGRLYHVLVSKESVNCPYKNLMF